MQNWNLIPESHSVGKKDAVKVVGLVLEDSSGYKPNLRNSEKL